MADMHPFEKKVRDFLQQKEDEANKFREAVPASYQSFLTNLEQNKKFNKPESWVIPADLKVHCWQSPKGFYVKYIQPYFPVAGLQALFNEKMDSDDSSYQLTADVVAIGELLAFKGRLIITDPTGRIKRDVEEWASINIGGGGVDATNPIENAATSLRGRLYRTQVGNFLPEVASAEEVNEAERRRNADDKPEAAKTSQATEAFYEVIVMSGEDMAFGQSGKLKGQEVTVHFPEGTDAGAGEAYIVRGAINEEGILVIEACVSCTGALEVKATKGRPAKKVKDGQDRYSVYAETILGTVQLIAESADVFGTEPYEVAILQESINRGVLILKVGKVA